MMLILMGVAVACVVATMLWCAFGDAKNLSLWKFLPGVLVLAFIGSASVLGAFLMGLDGAGGIGEAVFATLLVWVYEGVILLAMMVEDKVTQVGRRGSLFGSRDDDSRIQ